MADYLDVKLEEEEIRRISTLGLAHIGDAVFELMVRTWLCVQGKATSHSLHRAAVSYVSAHSQAAAASRIIPLLSEEETGVYMRGRNAHVNTVPKNAERDDYQAATALEALFGYLYLKERHERLNELFAVMMQ